MTCPAGKKAIGAGYSIAGGKTGDPPDQLLEVVAEGVGASDNGGFAEAYETDGIGTNWSLVLSVRCARVGP